MSGTPIPTRLDAREFAVETRGLEKNYGTRVALRNVSLQVPRASVYLFVGPNGAGKTTTIRILLDRVRADRGMAEVFGHQTSKEPELVRANVGYVPEGTAWGYSWMSVGRLLRHHARYFPSWDHRYANQLVRAFQLPVEQRVATLSKGQTRRVHLVMAMAHRPPLLILDEPTDGLDPVMREQTLQALSIHVVSNETTVVLSTHHVAEVDVMAQTIGILREGELCAQMPIAALRERLRRYRATVPLDWEGQRLFGTAAVRRVSTPSTIDWLVWGDQQSVVAELQQERAVIQDVTSVTLQDAALALLGGPGVAQ